MDNELERQETFWSKELPNFDAIYSHKKSPVGTLLDKLFRKDMYERFDYTMKHAEPVEDCTFLDVGCGTGRYSMELLGKGCRHVTGIDISPAMVERCATVAREAGQEERTEFVVGDLLAYKSDRKFDVSIGIGLFDYIRDPLPVLTRMCELTNSKAILSFPRLWTWRAPVRKVRLGLKGCPVFFYSVGRVEDLLRRAGFARNQIDVVGKLFCVVASR